MHSFLQLLTEHLLYDPGIGLGTGKATITTLTLTTILLFPLYQGRCRATPMDLNVKEFLTSKSLKVNFIGLTHTN